MLHEIARNYGIVSIPKILPLDEETCKEIINYTLTLSDHQIESHLLDLLGDSDASLRFISTFLELKKNGDEAVKKEQKRAELNEKKAQEAEPKGIPRSKTATAWTSEKPKTKGSSKLRLLNNKDAVTLSELADIKPSNVLLGNKAKALKKKNLDSIMDIEAALNDLEVEESKFTTDLESSSVVRRSCNCMATKHPLFEVAPNCLNCGKIICYKEGLQPCSSCKHELLTKQEKLEIIKVLKSEKELLETKASNPKNKSVQEQPSKIAKKAIKYSMKPGENLWEAQNAALQESEERARQQREAQEEEERRLKEIEEQKAELEKYQRNKNLNSELLKAQERLETLLHYQATGAERSKIIDNASDFEMPGVSSGSMWLSPVERALQLKKQQKQLRKTESQEKKRSGRTKSVMEMVIKNGKVTMVEKQVIEDHAPEDKDIDELEQTIKQQKADSEADLSRNVWDYEKDQEKWVSPIYESLGGEKSVLDSSFKPRAGRVQQNKLDEAELVAAMYS